jgi:hypothetical protein
MADLVDWFFIAKKRKSGLVTSVALNPNDTTEPNLLFKHCSKRKKNKA